MKRLLRISILPAIALLAIGCGSSENKVAEEYSPGETAFKNYCQTCHRLPKASDKSTEEWPAIVQKYGEKAKLSAKDQKAILDFLISGKQ